MARVEERRGERPGRSSGRMALILFSAIYSSMKTRKRGCFLPHKPPVSKCSRACVCSWASRSSSSAPGRRRRAKNSSNGWSSWPRIEQPELSPPLPPMAARFWWRFQTPRHSGRKNSSRCGAWNAAGERRAPRQRLLSPRARIVAYHEGDVDGVAAGGHRSIGAEEDLRAGALDLRDQDVRQPQRLRRRRRCGRPAGESVEAGVPLSSLLDGGVVRRATPARASPRP